MLQVWIRLEGELLMRSNSQKQQSETGLSSIVIFRLLAESQYRPIAWHKASSTILLDGVTRITPLANAFLVNAIVLRNAEKLAGFEQLLSIVFTIFIICNCVPTYKWCGNGHFLPDFTDNDLFSTA